MFNNVRGLGNPLLEKDYDAIAPTVEDFKRVYNGILS